MKYLSELKELNPKEFKRLKKEFFKYLGKRHKKIDKSK